MQAGRVGCNNHLSLHAMLHNTPESLSSKPCTQNAAQLSNLPPSAVSLQPRPLTFSRLPSSGLTCSAGSS